MGVVFLLDFDNTLVDNDQVRAELWRQTDRVLGLDASKAFWAVYEEVRRELGFVDFLATLERFHERDAGAPDDLDRVILDLDYAAFRYPAALATIARLWERGWVVVLSDGDPTFQPLKIAHSGVSAAVRGNVLVFAHKEERLGEVARLFPAERYVAVDDKAEVLGRIKRRWGERVRTVHVLQGKYRDDPYDGPPPDAVIAGIGELADLVGTDERLRLFPQGASIRPGG